MSVSECMSECPSDYAINTYTYSGAQKSESTPLLYLWFAYNIIFIVFRDIHNFCNEITVQTGEASLAKTRII